MYYITGSMLESVAPKISIIWKSIPSQLSRENKKFIYKVVKKGARVRGYEDALQWLMIVLYSGNLNRYINFHF
ncbi:hypothetical protein [Fusobacterium sp. SYSU M8A802]